MHICHVASVRCAEGDEAGCRDLYHLPCKATGQLLAMDQQSQQLLPPILRPFNVDPVNLELIAGGSVEAAAYHLHAFP